MHGASLSLTELHHAKCVLMGTVPGRQMDVTWNSHPPRGPRKCLLQICLEKLFLVSPGLEGSQVVILVSVFRPQMRSRERRVFLRKWR